MNEAELLDILRDGVTTALIIVAPPLLAALFVGVTVSLIQALTSLQEQPSLSSPRSSLCSYRW